MRLPTFRRTFLNQTHVNMSCSHSQPAYAAGKGEY